MMSKATTDRPQRGPSTVEDIAEQYAGLLHRAMFATDALSTEQALADAGDLGRALLALEVSLEEVGEMHHNALIRLATAHPTLPMARVAERVTMPLMEAYMAYSLAFREQLERRAETVINTRLEQSRRLEAIGTLAAGIAHDFNNILGAIIGFSELISDDLQADHPSRPNLQRIQQASFRARDLIARMLTFARELSDQPEAVDMVTLTRETVDLLQASLPANIQLELSSHPSVAWVLAEPSQIQQIVMNLCINASDAIGSQQGRIRLVIEQRDDASMKPPAVASWVRLTVSDNGEGMLPEVRERVFDPFFTTKAPGKGSGLGLSVVHGLVSKLGGQIALVSTPSAGSQFTIDLPRLSSAPDTTTPA